MDTNAKGTLLAIGHTTEDANDAVLVEAATGRTVARLRGHLDYVRDIRFSPDDKLVGSASNDGELIVWDTATGRPLERWDTFDPWGVGFSPDNDLVYSGGADSMLRTWDLSAENTYLKQTTQVGDVEAFAHAHISPDGRQVAYRWLDDQDRGWVRFVDTATGEAAPATRLPTDEAAWSPGTWHPQGGQYAAWCDFCALGIVSVFDTATGKLLREPRDIVDGDGNLWSLAYVDEGRSLLASSSDGRKPMVIVDPETLQPRGEPFDVVAWCCTTPIGDGSTAMVYEISGDGASMHWRVIDVNTGEVRREGDVDLRGFGYASVAAPDGSTVAVAGDAGEIVTIDVSTGEQRRSTSLGTAVRWLNYSDDGELLVSGAADGGVSLWDASTLDLLGTVYPPNHGRVGPGRRTVHRRHPRRRHRVVRRSGLSVGDRPRPSHRLRLPDGRADPDRGGVGSVPARAALPVRLPGRVSRAVTAATEGRNRNIRRRRSKEQSDEHSARSFTPQRDGSHRHSPRSHDAGRWECFLGRWRQEAGLRVRQRHGV